MVLRILLAVSLLIMAAPAFAQSGTCPEAMMADVMDQRIADRQAKLAFVEGGGYETRSGLSNDPATLRQALSEMTAVRNQLLGDLFVCRRTQHLGRGLPSYVPDSAETGAVSGCPACAQHDERLDDIEARLALNLTELQELREANGLSNSPAVMASDFNVRSERLDAARSAFAEARAVAAALDHEERRVCASAGVHLGSNDSLYDDWGETDGGSSPYWDDPRLMLPPRHYLNNNPDLDPNRPLVDSDGDAVVFFYRDSDRQATPSEVRAYFADPDNPDAPRIDPTPYFDPHGQFHSRMIEGPAEAAASLADHTLEELREMGIPVPDGMELTDWGACNAAGRARERYGQEVLTPRWEELEAAAAEVPGGNDQDVMARFRELEGNVRDLRRERDHELDALLHCNINQCRPAARSTMEFIDEGEPSDDGLEPELDADDPEDKPYGGPDDGLEGDGPELAAADNETASPGMAEIPDLSGPNITRPILQGASAEEMALAHALSTGQYRQPQAACDFEVGNVCDKLGDPYDELCVARMTSWLRQCRRVEAFEGPGTMDQCRARCDHDADTARFNHWLHDQASAIFELNASDAGAISNAHLTDVEERLADATVELGVLEEQIAARRIQIYTNEETGETVQHDGDYFEPQPPLVYNGDMAAPPTEAQEERRTILQNRIQSLTEERDSLSAAESDLDPWRAAARAALDGGPNSAGPVAACAVSEIDSEQARCHAYCEAQSNLPPDLGPQALEICRPMSMLGLLNQPTSRRWLYPPGDPRQEPGYGR